MPVDCSNQMNYDLIEGGKRDRYLIQFARSLLHLNFLRELIVEVIQFARSLLHLNFLQELIVEIKNYLQEKKNFPNLTY